MPIRKQNALFGGFDPFGEQNEEDKKKFELHDKAFNVALDYEDELIDDDWAEGLEEDLIKEVKLILLKRKADRKAGELRRIVRAKQNKMRDNRAKIRKELKMSSLVHRHKHIPLANVSSQQLVMLFMGSIRRMSLYVGKTLMNRVVLDDILIACEGEYLDFVTFAEVYDDEDGDYPILVAISDAALMACYKVTPRKNNKTNKDKYLYSLAASKTPTYDAETENKNT